MAGKAVTWSSKRQATVALSTVEAEYIAMSRCAQQMTWMQTWLDEVEIGHDMPGIIKGDSRGAIALAKNTKDHGKVKHINIRHHYLCKLVTSGSILFEQISSRDNVADLFTKPLACDHHHRFLGALESQYFLRVLRLWGVLKVTVYPSPFRCCNPLYSYHVLIIP